MPGVLIVLDCLALLALCVAILLLARKVLKMSASFDRLKTAVTNVVAKVQTLEATPAGTPDAELDALSAQLEAVAPPTVPAPPPAAE